MNQNEPRRPILAIDGPAGAGKSTVARQAAARLGFTYIDTGAMYRGVALAARREGIDPSDGEAVAAVARRARLEFREQDGRSRLWMDGEDVGDAIREPEISGLASVVAAIPGVRVALVAAQREMGARGGVVMEGRDIGTVVFPDAEVKVYLDATPAERARRRHAELAAQGREIPLEQITREMEERDRRDTTRDDSPLKAAPGSMALLTDGLTIDQVVDRLVTLVEERRDS